MADLTSFIDCTSVNVSYNVMGLATISYTVVHQEEAFVTYDSLELGGQTFTGYIVNASLNKIPKTVGWYETQVTLLATTEE